MALKVKFSFSKTVGGKMLDFVYKDFMKIVIEDIKRVGVEALGIGWFTENPPKSKSSIILHSSRPLFSKYPAQTWSAK